MSTESISTVSSSHHANNDTGAFADILLASGYKIIEHVHNHPSQSDIPSGMLPKDKEGDVLYAQSLNKKMEKYHLAPPRYQIFAKNRYITYKANSIPEDFGRAPDGTWLPTLDEIIVTPK